MANVYKYRIWCTTDAEWKYEWAESEPTLCPLHHDSNITASKTAIIAHPTNDLSKTSDGRLMICPCGFPEGYVPVYPGVADDVANGVKYATPG